MVLDAVQRAELRNRNKPVNIVQIWQSCELSSQLHSTKFKMILLDLFCQNEIFSDESMTYYSAESSTSGPNVLDTQDREKEEDESVGAMQMFDCQSLLTKKFPGYKFDEIFRVVPGPETETMSFSKLQTILLCKDLERPVEELETQMPKFLDGKIDLGVQGQKIAI